MNPFEESLPEHIRQLLIQLALGDVDAEGRAELERWRALSVENETLFQRFAQPSSWAGDLRQMRLANSDNAWAAESERLNRSEPKPVLGSIRRFTRKPSHIRLFMVAASIALIMLIGGVYLLQHLNAPPIDAPLVILKEDVEPARLGAQVTTADGQTITLDEQSGTLLMDNSGITYEDGRRVLEVPNAEDLTLTVPRGSHYRLTLSDGTQVALNAGSQLIYPSQFTGSTRQVSLEGEAYFEVKRDSSKPFIVKTAGQQVEVLGTAFNIATYAEEATKTTLISGSVRLRSIDDDIPTSSVVLKPGQQGTLHFGKYLVQAVDTSEFTAWMRGMFVFNDRPLSEMLTEIGRWYDVEIEFLDTQADRSYYAEIPRTHSLSQVLNALSRVTNVSFKQEGRRIIVQ